MNLNELVTKISKESGVDEEKIKKMIEEKQDELSGLVSPEGAAYIIARELGVELLPAIKRELKINKIPSGLRNLEFVAKVLKIDEPREYQKGNKKIRVKSVWLADDTGIIRLALWNDEIERFDGFGIEEGMSVKVKGVFSVENNIGEVELRLGSGVIEETEPISGPIKEMRKIERKRIPDLEEGATAEIRAAIVHVFKNVLYEVCANCGARLKKEGEKWLCPQHGEIEPKYQPVLSCVIDDGYGNIRAVLFRDAAMKLLGNDVEKIRLMKDEDFEGLLGQEWIFKGRVKKNAVNENLELVVSTANPVDVKRECENMIMALSNNLNQRFKT